MCALYFTVYQLHYEVYTLSTQIVIDSCRLFKHTYMSWHLIAANDYNAAIFTRFQTRLLTETLDAKSKWKEMRTATTQIQSQKVGQYQEKRINCHLQWPMPSHNSIENELFPCKFDTSFGPNVHICIPIVCCMEKVRGAHNPTSTHHTSWACVVSMCVLNALVFNRCLFYATHFDCCCCHL